MKRHESTSKQDIYWGSVAAGFFLGLFGFIVILIIPEDPRGRAQSVAIGWAAQFVLGLLFLFVVPYMVLAGS